MSKTFRNRNKNSSKAKAGKNSFTKSEEKSPRRASKAPISGFSTLNQVAGVPKPREHHSSIPVSDPKRVNEPLICCAICGEKIDLIASAMTNPDGGYVHFDCALNRIKEEESLSENQVVSYIGSGNFGVCERDANGSYHIVKTINYESQEKIKAMKEFVESLKQ